MHPDRVQFGGDGVHASGLSLICRDSRDVHEVAEPITQVGDIVSPA
jgi:hypothetical protein